MGFSKLEFGGHMDAGGETFDFQAVDDVLEKRQGFGTVFVVVEANREPLGIAALAVEGTALSHHGRQPFEVFVRRTGLEDRCSAGADAIVLVPDQSKPSRRNDEWVGHPRD